MMKENKSLPAGAVNAQMLAQAAIIAALYVVLTMAFAPFSFKEIQVRLSEMLTILPFFFPAGVPGVFVGCLLGNMLSGAAVPDIIFGSLATLIAAVGTYYVGKKYREGNELGNVSYKHLIVASIPPIVANALIIPFVIKYAYGSPMPVYIMMLTVGLGEVISCGVIGVIFGKAVSKIKGII